MVRPDHARGVILSSGSLVLQRVRRRSAGNYTCVASNVEGDTASNPVKLNVMCESRILSAVVTHSSTHVIQYHLAMTSSHSIFPAVKPTCANRMWMVQGIGRGRSAPIVCPVEAHPRPTKYAWFFNNSSEVETVRH